jgi:uncharacterized protein involved in exopolysaccharide biosynthesis
VTGFDARTKADNMEELILSDRNGYQGRSHTLRDLVAIAFRHRRLMALAFLGVLSGAILTAWLQPNRYQAAMEILVKRDRVDAIVTPEASAVPQSTPVSEEELNSEVELLKSRELLEKIVLIYDLQFPSRRAHLAGLTAKPARMPPESASLKNLKVKASPDYVPARPVIQVLPDTRILGSLTDTAPEMKIAVRIDETGRVTEVHASDNRGKSNPLLADASIRAAKQRIFEPAKLGGKEIASDHVIDFQFRRGSSAFEPTNRFTTLVNREASLQAAEEPRTSNLGGLTPSAPVYEYRPVVGNAPPRGGIQSAQSNIAGASSAHTAVRSPEERQRIASAVEVLEKQLRVDVLKKTNLIAVNYESPNPELAERVLATLGDLYLQKHVKVHRPAGAFDFFQRETEQYRQALGEAEGRLTDFNRHAGVVSASLEKEVALQKLAEFQVTLKQTQAAITETEDRIRILQKEAASIPTRMVTQVRSADDGALLSQLRSNLLMLEQKRTELLGKFEPGYRLVQEVEAQIAQTRAALVSAEKSKLRDETTDRDPTYEWTRAELAKANADLTGLQARARTTALTVRWYQESARSLDEKGITQESLVRNIKEAEENYRLYLRKEEETRISDALDRGRILNVAIAEPARVSGLPSNHRLTTVLVGLFLATLTSLGLAFASERLDSTFRTPSEIGSILNIPVLAAIPRDSKNSITKLRS